MDLSGLVRRRGTSYDQLLLMRLPIDHPCLWCRALLMLSEGPYLDSWEEWVYLGCLLLLGWKSESTGCLLPVREIKATCSCAVPLVLGSQTGLPSSSTSSSSPLGCFFCYFHGLSLFLVGRSREEWVYLISSCHTFMHILIYSYVFPILLWAP